MFLKYLFKYFKQPKKEVVRLINVSNKCVAMHTLKIKRRKTMDNLVKRAKKGDAESFISLIEQNKQSMKRIAIAYLGNEEDVADALQDTILDAFEKIHTLKNAEYFKTWLIRILINNCISIQRRRSKVIVMDVTDEEQKISSELHSNLEFYDLLLKLPEETRVIFQMYYGEQFSIGEIAKLLKLKENTVKSKIHRGREQLRSQLDA